MEKFKIGDLVNALFFPSDEYDGIVQSVDKQPGHANIIGIQCDDGILRFTPESMVSHLLKPR